MDRETVSKWDKLIYTIAREHAQRFSYFDDAVQEARIKLWQAEQERGELTPRYAAGVIRNSVRNSVKHELWTGHNRKRAGRIPAGETNKDVMRMARQMPEHYDAPAASLLPELADSPVVRAVREAVAKLPERERAYVERRFWDHGAGRGVGLHGDPDGPLWGRVIKPKLRAALAKYAPVC